MAYSQRNQTLTLNGKTICVGTSGNKIPTDALREPAAITRVYFCRGVADGFIPRPEPYSEDRIHRGLQGLAIEVALQADRQKETFYIGGEGKFEAVMAALSQMGTWKGE